MDRRHTDDADRRPAADFGVTRDGGTSWFFEDGAASLELVERPDGELVARLDFHELEN